MKSEAKKEVVVRRPAGELAKVAKAAAMLDDKVAAIHRIRHSMHVSLWSLGAALNEIHLTRAWSIRTNENGTPTYTSFAGFCLAEIKMPVGSVTRAIGISRRFTEDQTRAYGPSRLYEVMAAPEAHWPELLAKCDAGATVTDIRRTVREIRLAQRKQLKGKATLPLAARTSVSHKSTSAASIAAAEKRHEKRETTKTTARPNAHLLAAQESAIVLTARRGPGEKAAKPAKSIAQQPGGLIAIEGAGTVSLSLYEGENGALCVDWKFSPVGGAS